MYFIEKVDEICIFIGFQLLKERLGYYFSEAFLQFGNNGSSKYSKILMDYE